MMFQRALPELNGFGVSTWMPGLTRSLQFWMFFGLPLRTTKTTTESVTKPFVGPLSQLDATRPALTSVSMSGVREKLTTSAGCPAATARDWVPDGPKDS